VGGPPVVQKDCLSASPEDNARKPVALMIPASFRPVLTLVAGIVIGLLLAWGIIGKFSAGSANGAGTPAPSANAPLVQPVATATASPEEQSLAAESSPSTSPSPSPEAQPNGLPNGVTQDALNYNKELYKKYPGMQPPVINTDGRNLGPEATQRIQGPPTMLPNPGGTPLASTTPAPFSSLAPLPLPFPNPSASPDPTALVQ
jgi:hypothetical protein